MDITVEHETGTDFGTLWISPGKDDDITLTGSGHGLNLQIPLYSHEAQTIIDALTALALAPPLD